MRDAEGKADRIAGPGARLRLVLAALLGCVLAVGITAAGQSGSADGRPASVPADAAAFDLEEISTFDGPESVRRQLLIGASAECRTEPESEVTRYPAFISDNPVYGSFHIGESAEADQGYRYAFAFDESAGTGRGYDRLYLDRNLNGDLTDEAYCVPMKDVPAGALIDPEVFETQVCFEPVALRVTPSNDPQQRLEVVPRFAAYETGPQYAMLTPTTIRTGTIRIGLTKLDAVLGNSGFIRGSLDHPETALFLLPPGRPGDSPSASWYGAEQLKAVHRSLGTTYQLAATPNGDRLFVWPYQGPFGMLEIKSGSRNAENVRAGGSLASSDMAISLTEGFGGTWLNRSPSDSFRLPVGDYCPLLLNLTFDGLSCMVLRNIHADGIPLGRATEAPSVYAIKIREDEPFVLDLSGTPEVLFATPGRNHRVRRGEELEVKAVLIDPTLDIMFRAIRDSGEINPTVTIARASGEIVAEGVMPFG